MQMAASGDDQFDARTVTFPSCGATLNGRLLIPRNANGKLAAIVMAPGMSGVKEGSIFKYARHFANNGFAVLAYDNINFGESGGEPRQQADTVLQRRGYRDAVTFVGLQPEIDKTKIGIWGTSMSGGHVLEVAAVDRRVKAVVSQIPGLSGLETTRRRTPYAQRLASQANLEREREALYQGAAPTMIKAVTDVAGEASVMAGMAAYTYFTEQAKEAPNWRNEVTLHSLDISRAIDTRPFVPFISPTPLLMIVAQDDELAPPDMAIAASQTALEPKKLVLITGHHFTPYHEHFELTSGEALSWFDRHLRIGGVKALNL
jgi:fermentation-respiration switch protein FrsA (DUF1100 family)